MLTLPIDHLDRAVRADLVRASLVQATAESSERLFRGVRTQLQRGRRAQAAALVRLQVLLDREAALPLGYGRLTDWLVAEAGCTPDTAWNLVSVAQMARDWPEVVAMVAEGALSLSVARRVVPLWRRGLPVEVLERFRGKTVREAEAVRAEIEEELRAEAEEGMTEEAARQGELFGAEGPSSSPTEPVRTASGGAARQAAPNAANGRTKTEPARERRRPGKPPRGVVRREREGVRLSVVLDEEAARDLEACQALLGHAVPNGSPAAVVARALRHHRQYLERRRFGSRRRKKERHGATRERSNAPQPRTESEARVVGGASDRGARAGALARGEALRPRGLGKGGGGGHRVAARRPESEPAERGAARRPDPRPPSRRQRRRALPAAVRRAVYERDRGRCVWRDPRTGRVCGSQERLEFDHIVPIACGGGDTVDNLRLLCRRHNQYEARRRGLVRGRCAA